MTTVRELEAADLAAVSRLFLEVTPASGWHSPEDCAAYLGELLFGNPWQELRVPSWVAELDGRIVAFYLLLPRPMRFRGEEICAAVGFQMAVHPDFRRGLAALRLAKAALNGPQDLLLADGANDASRNLWRGLGGQAPLIYNLHWIRPLRPARQLLGLLQERRAAPAAAVHAARPVAALLDRVAARLRWNDCLHCDDGRRDPELMPDDVLDGFDTVVDADLRPHYDHEGLSWLLEQLAAKTDCGRLRARAVRGGGGGLRGWYLYMLKPGGISEVVQIAARKGDYDTVLCRLLADAWRQGAAAVHGRAEAGQIETLSARHCWLRREGCRTLTHSRHPEIVAALDSGRAFLSRLDGEWWLRLVSA